MQNKNLGLRVAGTIFGIIATLHLLRLIFRWEAIFAGITVPHWASIIGFVVTGGLSAWLWRLSLRD